MTVIAISGLVCAGSSTLAKLLSSKLMLGYFSPGSYIKNKLGGDSSDFSITAYDGYLKKHNTQKAIDRLQRIIAKKDDVVVDGKLSIFILNDLSNINIWLYADSDCRAYRLAKRYGITFDDARILLLKRETSENSIWKKLYGINFVDLSRYAEMHFNSEIESPESIVDQIRLKFKEI